MSWKWIQKFRCCIFREVSSWSNLEHSSCSSFDGEVFLGWDKKLVLTDYHQMCAGCRDKENLTWELKYNGHINQWKWFSFSQNQTVVVRDYYNRRKLFVQNLNHIVWDLNLIWISWPNQLITNITLPFKQATDNLEKSHYIRDCSMAPSLFGPESFFGIKFSSSFSTLHLCFSAALARLGQQQRKLCCPAQFQAKFWSLTALHDHIQVIMTFTTLHNCLLFTYLQLFT